MMIALACASAWCASGARADAASASARLELPDPLVPGVELEGSLIIENSESEADSVSLPSVPGLEWEEEPGGATQINSINGVVTRSQTIRISLRAQANVTLSIPAITITLQDGSTLQTAAITVKPQSGNSELTGDAHGEATFDPPDIVPGEPTTLVYRLFLRQNHDFGIKEPGITPPSGAISLGTRTSSQTTTRDSSGHGWSVQTYRWPMTFSTPGQIVVNGQQEYFLCRRDFFGQLVPISSHQLAIKPATLTVTALPVAGRPPDFNGLFGPLAVDASLERSPISAGEGTVLTLHIHGRQVELLTRPAFTPPAGIQSYTKEDPTPEKANATGMRTYRWDLVPDGPGTFTIAPFSFSYFDPTTHSYRRAVSDTLTLTVRPGRMREVTVSGATQNDTLIQPVTGGAPQLPMPLRGQAAGEPRPGLQWICALLALVLGLCSGALQRWLTRPARTVHRGQMLSRAVAARDAARIAQYAHALLPDLTTADARAAAEHLLQSADLARFGGQPLATDLTDAAKLLELVP